jgi:hypothetical protein
LKRNLFSQPYMHGIPSICSMKSLHRAFSEHAVKQSLVS